jgi:hypothetical protein
MTQRMRAARLPASVLDLNSSTPIAGRFLYLHECRRNEGDTPGSYSNQIRSAPGCGC